MNSKDFLKFGSSSLIMGSSLASLVGTANVNAQGPFSSIKNFFLKNKTENEEKKLSLKERKEKHNYNCRNKILSYFGFEAIPAFLVGTFFSGIYAGRYYGGELLSLSNNPTAFNKLFIKGVFFSALISIGLGIYSYITNMSAKNNFTELGKLIGEDMLKGQWSLECFKEMVKDKKRNEKFVRQLLVLEPNPNTDGGNGSSLDKKTEAFIDLFSKEPEDLKKEEYNDKKEIYKELINSLYYWCIGIMDRLEEPEPGGVEFMRFEAQKDIELASKIVLLKEIFLGENINYPECISFLTSEDFYKNLTDESKTNFKKLLLYDIRRFVSAEDVSDEYIINILKELTESTNVGTIKSRYDRLTHREHEVLVISAEGKNKARNNQIFKDALKTFSKERIEAKKENIVDIYKKQLRILKGIKKFSDEKHRFEKRFEEKKYDIDNYGCTYFGIVDNLSFRAQATYNGISKEYEECTRLKS